MSRHTFRGCCGGLALGFVALSPLRGGSTDYEYDAALGWGVMASKFERSISTDQI